MVSITGYDLAVLKGELTSSRRQAYAEGTRQGHYRQWKSFIKFCLHYGLQWLPLESEVISLYAQFIARSVKSPDTVKNYISSVKVMYIILNQPVQGFSSFELRLALKGIARSKRHRVKQAAPITPQLLAQFTQHLDLQHPVDATYWSLFLTAFFAMARKSNLVPESAAKYDPKKQLCRDRVLVGQQCLLLIWDWAKNIQQGERMHKVPLLPISGSLLCPVSSYKQMCKLVPAEGTDPAFCVTHKGKRVPITYRQFNAKLKQLVGKCGLEPSKFSSHSFRRGGATCAFRARVPETLIQLQGDWASNCYKNYLRMGLQEKPMVSASMNKMVALQTRVH